MKIVTYIFGKKITKKIVMTKKLKKFLNRDYYNPDTSFDDKVMEYYGVRRSIGSQVNDH